jgi:SAM-dependent methyltransferase
MIALHPVEYDRIAELYDRYVTADYDIPFFVSTLPLAQGGEVVELTAGTGRLSIPLIEAGARLTCVDLSPKMLDVLRRKLVARDLKAEVLCRNVCRLDLPSRYALALMPFQAFMEIVDEAEQLATLRSVFACLEPGGHFICTLHNPTVRRLQVDGTMRAVGSFPSYDGTLVVSGSEAGGDPIVVRSQFFESFGLDGELRWKRLLSMRFALIGRDAFERMATDAGFRVAALMGDYSGGPFRPESSPVMIWTLERPV